MGEEAKTVSVGRPVLETISAFALTLSGLAFFALAGVSVANGWEGAPTSLVAAVAALVLARLPHIRELKFGLTGVEARMEEAVREMEVRLAQLQGLAVALARAGLLQSKNGLWSYGRYNDDIRGLIVVALKECGATDRQIEDVLSTERLADDYGHCLAVIEEMVHGPVKAAISADISAAFRRGSLPSAKELERELNDKGLLSQAALERIGEYERHLETRITSAAN